MKAADYCRRIVSEALTAGDPLPPLQLLSDETGLDVREVRAIVQAMAYEHANPKPAPAAPKPPKPVALVEVATPVQPAATGGVQTPDTTQEPVPDQEQLAASDLDVIAAGVATYADHDGVRVRDAAQYALAAVEDLQDALRRHDAEAGLRERLAELEAEAQAIRQQLGATDAAETAACDVCGKACKPQGLAVHKARAHRKAAS